MTNVSDPDRGSGALLCFFDNPGWKKIRIQDEHPGSYFRELSNNFLDNKILKFFDANPDPGSF